MDFTTLKDKAASVFKPQQATTSLHNPGTPTMASGFYSAEDARKAHEANPDGPMKDNYSAGIHEKGKDAEERRRQKKAYEKSSKGGEIGQYFRTGWVQDLFQEIF